MTKKIITRLTAATAIAILTLSAPVLTNPMLAGVALAKDHGGGNGGGHGNGTGGGNGGGKSDSSHGSGKSDKSGKAHSSDDGQDDQADQDQDQDASGTRKTKTSGVLNAAHASATARAHAAPNSAVGKIATYERERREALSLTDAAAQRQALADAVADLEKSFGRTFTKAQIAKINALLERD